MAQFYGWTHHYIMNLDYGTALEYYEAITVIDAQDRLVDLNVADYPQLKKEDRSKLHREFRNSAYPKEMQKEVSFDDFIRKMTDGRN